MEFEELELEHVRRQIHKLEERGGLWGSELVLGGLVLVGGLLGAFWVGAGPAQELLSLTRGQLTGLLYILGVLAAGYHMNIVIRNRDLLRVRTELLLESLKNEITRLQGMVDPLTRVYNRQSMEELLKKWIQRSERYEQLFSLAVLDLDGFKSINDRFGHLTGDLVLSEMAQILRSSVRGSDLVIRYGGDEFLLVLAETEQEGAEIVANRVRTKLGRWNARHTDAPYEISASIGLSVFEKGKTASELIFEADQAMYREKQSRLVESAAKPS